MNTSKEFAQAFLIEILKLTLFAMMVLAFFSQAQANPLTPEIRGVVNASEYRPHFGASAGYAAPEGNLDSAAQFGFEVGYQPIIPLSTALEINYARHGGGDLRLSRTAVLAKAAYNFGGATPIVRHAYVSLGLGPLWENSQDREGVSLGIQPSVGIDHPIRLASNDNYSIGANVGYLVTSSSEADVLNTKLVLKYWY